MSKQLCSRCKRELDWEEVEMIKRMSREELIKLCMGFRKALKEQQK